MKTIAFTEASLAAALNDVQCLSDLGPELIAASVFRQHPEQVEGTQGEREAFERWHLETFGLVLDAGIAGACQERWGAWQARADLAQPSPVQAEQPEEWRDMLAELQWHYEPYDDHYHKDMGYYCPRCGGEQDTGHKQGCDLAKLLAAAPQPSAQFTEQHQTLTESEQTATSVNHQLA